MSHATVIGHDRKTREPVTLPLASRMQGLYVLGKTGMGKSNFLLSLIRQDLEAGHGVCVLDPHGDLTVDVLALVPPHRENDVILLDLQDTGHPFAFDLFAGVDPDDPDSLATGEERIVGIFKKVWGDSSWGPRLEDLLANAAQTLLANPGTTLADIPRLLTDAPYRQRLVASVANPIVVDYWLSEYDSLTPRGQAGIYAPLMNKVRAFLRHSLLSRIVSQPGATIDFDQVLATRQVLLVRLNAKLKEATSLLGAAIVLRLFEAALKRGNVPETQRPPFLLYADEFQLFATPTFGELLEQVRKYRVGTTIAHQHRSQLSSSYLQAAVKGAANLVCFQLQADDAREMAREFSGVRPEAVPDGDIFQWARQHPNPAIAEAAGYLVLSIPLLNVYSEWEDVSPDRFRVSPDHELSDAQKFAVIQQTLRHVVRNRLTKASGFSNRYHCSTAPRDSYAFTLLSRGFDTLRDHFLTVQPIDPPLLANLKRGEAAAKMQLASGMHESIVTIPLAISPECSATVHTLLQFGHEPEWYRRLPFTPSPTDYEAGLRAWRIREQNRARYRSTITNLPPVADEHDDDGMVPPGRTEQPTPKASQPKKRRLPVVAEVDLDE